MAAIINKRQKTTRLIVKKHYLRALEAELLQKVKSDPKLDSLYKETKAKRELIESEIEQANVEVKVMQDDLKKGILDRPEDSVS